MIDAYEIGIQLALQDDVSAGLAVISRELADVDRAIAATNAGLVHLVQSADAVKQAVIGVAHVGKRPAVEQSSEHGESTLRTSDADAQVRSGSDYVPASPTERPRQEDSLGNARQDNTEATPPVESSVPVLPQPETTQQATSPVARRFDGQVAPIIINHSENSNITPQVAETEITPASPSGQASRAAGSTEYRAFGVKSEDAVTEAEPSASPRRVDLRSVTASVSTLVLPSRNREMRKDEQPAIVAQPEVNAAISDRGVVAPSPTIQPRHSVPGVMRSAERAVAPQPPPRELGDSGGGTVMLDGRLVGYWLSEQMAREASRPPTGTTYFDPRQTPAWTASGAL